MKEFIEPLISVIVPVYNNAPYLCRCVDSILRQTYDRLEVFLINDGSVDKSGEICDEYMAKDERVRAIHKENGGTVSARKCGLDCASGQLVSFIDGDDWIEADTYERVVGLYFQEKCPDVLSTGMFFEPMATGMQEIWMDGAAEGRYDKQDVDTLILPQLVYDPSLERNTLMTSVCSKLVVTAVAKRAMEYMSFDLTLGEDGAYIYFLMASCSSLAVFHKAFYHYEQHDNSQNYKYEADTFLKLIHLRQVMDNGMERLGFGNNHYIQGQIDYFIWGYLWRIVVQNLQLNMNGCMYLFPFSKCEKGCKVLIYGAGKVGKSYMKYLMKSQFAKEVIWADRDYRKIQDDGFQVISVEEALGKEYDCIIIAIEKENVAESVIDELILLGVEKEKIIWEKPRQINPCV